MCDRLCGLVVLDATQPDRPELAHDGGLLISAVGTTTADVATYKEGVSGDEADPAQPWEVCDSLAVPEVASQGVYFPHPLKSFGRIIEIYLITVNGATAVVGTLIDPLCKAVDAQMRSPMDACRCVFAPTVTRVESGEEAVCTAV